MKTKLFLSFFFASVLILAQSGNEILKRAQTKFNSITSFSANFTQTYYDAQGKSGNKTSGKFFYKRKNKFIVEQKNVTITSDGETIWNFDKAKKRVVISYFSDEPTSFSIERYIFDYPSQCRVKFSKSESTENELVVILTPKDEQIDFKETKLWVNSNNLISRLEIVDLMDIKYSFSFTDIIENPELNDSRFSFYPPKGIQIIDLR